jgi:hypothetical protein
MARAFDKPKYKTFNITPRYWDPEKEEKQSRERRVKAKLGIEDEDDVYIPNIKGQFTSKMQERFEAASAAKRTSTVRLFFILTILLIGAYYLVFKYVDIF